MSGGKVAKLGDHTHASSQIKKYILFTCSRGFIEMTSFRLENTTITSMGRRDEKEKEKAKKPSHFH